MIAALRAADPDAVLVRRPDLDQVLARYPESRNYCRFAFLRHPWHRTYSFHADKHTLALRQRADYRWFVAPWHGLRPGMSFGELCAWLNTSAESDVFADRHRLSQSRQIVGRDGRLKNLEDLKKIGFAANPRLLRVQRVSHDCAIGARTFDDLHRPRIVDRQRASALRFGDPRVQALLAALLSFRVLPDGLQNRDLRETVAPLIGCPSRSTAADT